MGQSWYLMANPKIKGLFTFNTLPNSMIYAYALRQCRIVFCFGGYLLALRLIEGDREGTGMGDPVAGLGTGVRLYQEAISIIVLLWME